MSQAIPRPNWADGLDWERHALLPCIVQDASNGEVLMLAWCNEASLERTFETGTMWFWSRSRQSLWNKGATSGAIQHVRRIFLDCDGDTLLALVDADGDGACHRGTPTCWDCEPWDAESPGGPRTWLPALERLIQERARRRPEGSYVTSLLEKRIDRVAKKITEEAGEVILAAKNAEAGAALDELAEESADLLFHLMVLWQHAGLSPDAVGRVLEGRRMPSTAQSQES